jgi:hypothetical protein
VISRDRDPGAADSAAPLDEPANSNDGKTRVTHLETGVLIIGAGAAGMSAAIAAMMQARRSCL